MATPIQIAEDLIRGKAYFSDLNANNIAELFKGCSCNGDNKLSVCLARIVKSLQYRVDQAIYDDITDTLYTQMMLIIGDYQVSPPEPVNYGVSYGYSPVDYTGNYENMIFQFTKQIPLGSTSISLNYTNPSAGNYLFFRVLTGQPIFNVWTIDIDEHGVIPDIQWKAPVTFGLYDYYLSRQLVFLNPGNTTITYTGTAVPFQKITLSMPLKPGLSATGSVEVIMDGITIYNLTYGNTVTLNRVIPKAVSYKNSIVPDVNTNSSIYGLVNGDTDNPFFINTGQSYNLTDLNSVALKTIQFNLQGEE